MQGHGYGAGGHDDALVGIRPGAVQRLRWEDIDTQEGVVYIAPQYSKTGGARLVPGGRSNSAKPG